MMRATGEDELAAWKRLCGTLGLAGVDAGEEASAASGPERWAGTVEEIRQEPRGRYLLVRLGAPSPGILLLGVHTGTEGLCAVCRRTEPPGPGDYAFWSASICLSSVPSSRLTRWRLSPSIDRLTAWSSALCSSSRRSSNCDCRAARTGSFRSVRLWFL